MTKNEVLEIMKRVCRAGAINAVEVREYLNPDLVPDNPLVPIQGNRPLDEYLELCADWAENELRK